MVFDIFFYALVAMNVIPVVCFLVWMAAQPFILAYRAIAWRHELAEQRAVHATNPVRIPRRVDMRDSEKVAMWLGRHDLA